MCTPIRKFKFTNTIINNHDNSFYIANLYTVSTDKPVIMFIFLIYSLALRFQQQRNREVCTTTLLFIQNIGGAKDITPPCSKVGGCPPLELSPCITLYSN